MIMLTSGIVSLCPPIYERSVNQHAYNPEPEQGGQSEIDFGRDNERPQDQCQGKNECGQEVVEAFYAHTCMQTGMGFEIKVYVTKECHCVGDG